MYFLSFNITNKNYKSNSIEKYKLMRRCAIDFD